MASFNVRALLFSATAASLVAGLAPQANAQSEVAPYLQRVQVSRNYSPLQVTQQPVRSAGELSNGLKDAINEMSGARTMPATKVSKYSLNADVDAGTLIDNLIDLPIMARLKRGGEIVYVQQFATQQEANAAKALCPVKIPVVNCEQRSVPINARAALRLKSNEMVTVTFEKSFMGGIDFTDVITSSIGVGLRKGLLVKGEFEAQIMRLEGSKVRLRVIASRGTGTHSRAKVEVPIEVFTIAVAGGVSLTPYASITRDTLDGTMSVTDLVFDLSNAEAAAAYDSILAGAFSLKDMLNPIPYLVTDLAPIYQMAVADRAKPVPQRRISLVSRMNSDFEHKHKRKEVGVKVKALGVSLKIVSKKKETNNNQVISTMIDANGNETFTRLDSSARTSGSVRILFGLIGAKEHKTGSTAVLSTLDHQGRPTGEINFIVAQEVRDNKLRTEERQKLISSINRRMAPVLFQRLNVARHLDMRRAHDAHVATRVIFGNRALSLLAGKSAAEIEAKIKVYAQSSQDWLRHYRSDITEMATALATGVNTRADLNARTEALISLRDNSAFRDIGTGFMMWLMNTQQIDSLVAVKLYVKANGETPMEVQVGTVENAAALEAAQFVDDELNGVNEVNSVLALNATIVP